MSLYLKYRPKLIDELDLTRVREALQAIVKSGNIAHAYLFTGPRGAGKTSSARILARVVNCEKNQKGLGEPCNECPACQAILTGGSLDFIEIDAASNRGIDDIRELKEKIRLAPAGLSYKVYIIDEVHMLTTEAFNALLKTLEEPPKHAIFILCTTETHKVPATIVSRCEVIQFGKASATELVRSLSRVASGEGKKVEPEALDYLARNVDGSFRDGVKILDRVLSENDEVTKEIMESTVAGGRLADAEELVIALAHKDMGSALTQVKRLDEAGVELAYLLTTILKRLRDRVVEEGEVELIPLIYSVDEVARKAGSSPVPMLLLEMAVIEWCGGSDRPKTQGVKEPEKPDNQKSDAKSKRVEKESKVSQAKQVSSVKSVVQDHVGSHKDVWEKLLASLNGDSITMGALLSKATPAELAGGTLTIHVGYAFHRDQIMSSKVLTKLESALEKAVGTPVRVVCEVDDASAKRSTDNDSDDTIEDAIAIFT